MRDRIAGALYGITLGDAMGTPAELQGRKRVKTFFGRIEGFLDRPTENDVAFNYKKDQFTDDTGQALILLDPVESTDYEPGTRNIALRMLAWAEEENAFENNILGPTSKVALANLRDNIQDSRITDKALPNGSTMRIAPTDCLSWPEQKEDIAKYVYLMSRAIHTSDVTITETVMIAEAVNSAIMKDDFEKVMEDVLGIEKISYGMSCKTFSPRLGKRLRTGLDIAGPYKGDNEGFIHRFCDMVGAGIGIIGPVPIALSVAYYVQDPNLSCLFCANMAGDTDTIGAMATAVCEALTGMGRIKPEYIRTLRQQNDAGFDRYIRILEKGGERFV